MNSEDERQDFIKKTKAGKEEKMVTDLLIFGGWLGLLTIIAVIDELLKKRKNVRK
jgi:hypothetical protein